MSKTTGKVKKAGHRNRELQYSIRWAGGPRGLNGKVTFAQRPEGVNGSQ